MVVGWKEEGDIRKPTCLTMRLIRGDLKLNSVCFWFGWLLVSGVYAKCWHSMFEPEIFDIDIPVWDDFSVWQRHEMLTGWLIKLKIFIQNASLRIPRHICERTPLMIFFSRTVKLFRKWYEQLGWRPKNQRSHSWQWCVSTQQAWNTGWLSSSQLLLDTLPISLLIELRFLLRLPS